MNSNSNNSVNPENFDQKGLTKSLNAGSISSLGESRISVFL